MRAVFFLVLFSSLFSFVRVIDDNKINVTNITSVSNVDNKINATNLRTDHQGNVYITPGNGVADAFGRLRVSTPQTLFDSKQLGDNAPLFWDEVTNGSGSNTYSFNNSATMMTVSASNDYAIRQTKMRPNYQPGKSHQILMTFCFSNGTANVVKRVGYFNSDTNTPYTNNRDGIYLEQDGTNMYIVISKNGTATRVIQSNWDDPMDGSGQSGITIDWTKTQILQIQVEWLGVGSVQCALVVDGKFYFFYTFLNANNKSSVYMRSPSHSLRYEIYSTGGAACLMQICSSVASEGGSDLLGTIRYVSTEGAAITATNENEEYGLIAIRLKTNFLETAIRLLDVALQIQTASEYIEWNVHFNPTLTGTVTWNDLTNSAIQYAILTNGNQPVGGFHIGGGFGETGSVATGGSSISQTLENALRLGSRINGDRDIIVICVRPIGGASGVAVEAALFWREQL